MNIQNCITHISSGDLNKLKELFKNNLIDKSYTGRTCLHFACYYNNPLIVGYLIEEGCDIEAVSTSLTWNGYRPIHIAAHCGNKDNVITLIRAGCALSTNTNDGDTPLDIAIKQFKLKCAAIIKEAMKVESSLPLESYWKKKTKSFFKDSVKLECLISMQDYIFSNEKLNLEVKIELNPNLDDNDVSTFFVNEDANIFFILLFKTSEDNVAAKGHDVLMTGDQLIEINGVSMLCHNKEEIMSKLINIIEIAQESENDMLNVVVMRRTKVVHNYSPLLSTDKTKLIHERLIKNSRLEEDANDYLSKILLIKTANESFNTNDRMVVETLRNKPIGKKEIKEWLSMKEIRIHIKSYDLLHECLLYRCICHNYQEGFATLCSPEIVNKETLLMGPTALETSVNYGSVFCVDRILKKLVKVDDSWTGAEDVANKNELKHISSLISERKMYINNKYEKGYNRLHIAVLDNDSVMVEYILQTKLIDPDENQKKVGTALSLAYSLGNMKCIECLQNNHVSVNILDKMNQSSLHKAISNRIQIHSDYLVDNITDIEVEDIMGFTLLERAVMNGCEYICQNLVKKGVRCNKFVRINSRFLNKDRGLTFLIHNPPHVPLTYHESIYTLCFKVNKTVYPALLDTLDEDSVNFADGNGDTLLHLCAASLCDEMCKELILKTAIVDCRNKRKNTPLLELLQRNKSITKEYQPCGEIFRNIGKLKRIRKIAKLLINAGASVNVANKFGVTVMEKATEFEEEKLLLVLIKNLELLKSVHEYQWSTWLFNNYYIFLKKVIPLMNKPLLAEFISEDLIERYIISADISFIKVLYENASYNTKVNVIELILLEVVSLKDLALFKDIIDQDILPDTCSDKKPFLLSQLIYDQMFDFCRLIIRSRNAPFFLGKSNSEMKLPLHICIETEYWEILDHVIMDTKCIDQEDHLGNTPLSMLLEMLSKNSSEDLNDKLMGYVKMLIRKDADIYKVNRRNEAIITYCTKSDLKSQITSFFERYRQSERVDGKVMQVCSVCKYDNINCALSCGHTLCMTCADKASVCHICLNEITLRISLHF